MTCAPSEDSGQSGHLPSLIRVFALHSMASKGPKISSDRQQRLWSDWANAQADQSSLAAQVILLVLSCGGSTDIISWHHLFNDSQTRVLNNFLITCYCHDPKFSGKHILSGSHGCIILVKQNCSNSRIITATFSEAKSFRFLLYMYQPHHEKTCFCYIRTTKSACTSAQSDQCFCYLLLRYIV